ncbi:MULTISPECIES: AAA family ATPase [unclassified Streptomyces]|uniref:AAA family ATPase n=1 Tax=unclassified Streptomyces TaxID=2593676 RepID=UPI00380B0CE4
MLSALEKLSEALTATHATVPTPLGTALMLLSEADVEHSLNSTPVHLRRNLLRALRIPIDGTRVNRALCQDVLARIRRDPEAVHARDAAHHLTYPLYSDLVEAGFRTAHSSGEHASWALTRRWSPALLRIAVWARLGADAGSARIWAWSLRQPWIADSGVVVEAALSAADRVVALLTAPADAPADVPHDTAEETGQDSGRTGEATAGVRGRQDDLGAAEAAAPACEPAASLATALQRVTDALEAAADPLRRVSTAIAAQAPPAEEDLDALAEVSRAFRIATEGLRGHGGEPETADLDDLRRETAAVLDRLASAPLRERLLRVATSLTCEGTDPLLVQDLAAARERAHSLTARQEWDARQITDAEALDALLTMVELHAEAQEPAEILALLPHAAKSRSLAYPAARYTELRLVPNAEATHVEPFGKTPADPGEVGQAHGEPGSEEPVDAADLVPTPSNPATASLPGMRTGDQEDPVLPEGLGVSDAKGGPDPAVGQVLQNSVLRATPASLPQPRPVFTSAPGSQAEPTAHAEPTRKRDSAAEERNGAHASLAELIAVRRYGLAASLAESLDESASRIMALRIAACSEAVRSASSESVPRIRALLSGPGSAQLAASRADATLTTAALLRSVLVTGDSEAGAMLSQVSTGMPLGLARISDDVAQLALKSLLVHSPPLSLARDTAELERALEEAREDCRQGLTQVPNIRFPRGRKIARHWWDPQNGLIGSLLRTASDDDRSDLDELSRRVRELREPAVIQSKLDKVDRELMSSGARARLEGPARQDILRQAGDRLAQVERWILRAQELAARDTDWSADQVQDMRGRILAVQDDIVREVREQAVAGDPVAAAEMEAAVASLIRTFALLAGDSRLDGTELTAELALHAELLKVPGATVFDPTGEIRLRETPAAQELVIAGRRSWEEAVRIQVEGENFAAARALLDLWSRRQLPDLDDRAEPEALHPLVAEVGRQVASELNGTRQRLEEELRRARVDGALTEEKERAFERRIQQAFPRPDGDLAQVRRDLESLSEELSRARAAHAAALRSRLDEIDGLDIADRARVEQLIESGDLLTADELISYLVNGESIPDTEATDQRLGSFFPDVPNALDGTGVSEELITSVRRRERFMDLSALDYSALSPEIAEQTAQALEGWMDLAARKGSQRTHGVRESELLMPALRLVGYSSKKGPQRVERPRSGSYRVLDLPAVTYTGSALVPAFGSGLRGSLRMMLVWDRPSAETLLSWIQQDPNDDSLLVVYLGTLSVRNRSALAAQSIGGRRAIVVLDDAALAHLAARGNQRLDSAMRILLPFSAVNPYVMGKRAPVAEEMFFGRHDELKSVQRATGDQVVFGGRGLGKSALLKEAGREFEAQRPDERISLLLSLDSTFTGTNAPSSTVWDRIGRRLQERDVLPQPRRSKTDTVLTYQQVLDGIKAWRSADTKRGLLIMLDEADGFFESDSPQFTETRRLRDLGAETEDQVKVVFAGLHSVQRYAKIAVNSPFSHLAQRPTVIGPLRPQDAVNLLVEPLAVLGYVFEDPALVHRILGHCSYQPFLLQMFGHRLVQAMHAKRGGSGGRPPYTITRTDVATVQSDRDLRRSITEAFHDTLRLDSRYNVIANVVAHHAHYHGLDARLNQIRLREECTYWWPEGFENLDTDQFRAYLSEMEGLGVLAPDPDHRGWHLRSANALSMIGNLEMVEAELEQASSRQAAELFSKFEARHRSRDGRSHSPLTADQVADVLPGHGNQARLIIGTVATGIDRVAAALRDVAVTSGWEMPHIAKRSDFGRELTTGTRNRQRLVLADLTVKAPNEDTCRETVESAVGCIPAAPGVTRSAVILAGPEQRCLWSLALGEGSGGHDAEIEALALRRFTLDGLRAWAQDRQSPVFTSEAQLARVHEVTGGWPLLVDVLSGALAEGRGDEGALAWTAERLATAGGAGTFLVQAGLTLRSPQWSAYRAVHEFMGPDGMRLNDMLEAISMVTDSERLNSVEALEVLRALQVFDVDSAGIHRPERVLQACWRLVHTG